MASGAATQLTTRGVGGAQKSEKRFAVSLVIHQAPTSEEMVEVMDQDLDVSYSAEEGQANDAKRSSANRYHLVTAENPDFALGAYESLVLQPVALCTTDTSDSSSIEIEASENGPIVASSLVSSAAIVDSNCYNTNNPPMGKSRLLVDSSEVETRGSSKVAVVEPRSVVHPVAPPSPNPTHVALPKVEQAVEDVLLSLRVHPPQETETCGMRHHPAVYLGYYNLALTITQAAKQQQAWATRVENILKMLRSKCQKAVAASAAAIAGDDIKISETSMALSVQVWTDGQKKAPLSIFAMLAKMCSHSAQAAVSSGVEPVLCIKQSGDALEAWCQYLRSSGDTGASSRSTAPMTAEASSLPPVAGGE